MAASPNISPKAGNNDNVRFRRSVSIIYHLTLTAELRTEEKRGDSLVEKQQFCAEQG